MELPAGARSETNLIALYALMARSSFEPVHPIDYEFASMLYRTARRSGITVRSLMDCVIAAVAIRIVVPVLHHDRDLDALASCSELRIHRPIA